MSYKTRDGKKEWHHIIPVVRKRRKRRRHVSAGAEAAAKKWRGLIGASLSKPHTSELNGGFSYIIISAVRIP